MNDLIVCTYEDPLFNVAFDYYEVEPVNKLVEELRDQIQALQEHIEELERE